MNALQALQPPTTLPEVYNNNDRYGKKVVMTLGNLEEFMDGDMLKQNLEASRKKRREPVSVGFPSEQWEVNLPAEREVPPELPEPALGNQFASGWNARKKTGYSLVAVTVMLGCFRFSFYFGARFGFEKSERKRLFNMINDLPTVFEVVNGTAQINQKEKSTVSNHSSTKSKSNSKPPPPPPTEEEEEGLGDEEEEDDDEHGETLCGSCGEYYASDEFWICCDICEKWFHGKCVNITPARAEKIKQYKCPSCSAKRARP
ncbi:PHD finger protein ALFIN-LIKE 4 [Tanacetum coccineum]